MDLARRASRRPAAYRLAVAALLVAAAGCTSRPAGTAAAPPPAAEKAAGYLQGRPLAGPTGLRLLVAADPPRLLDVDRGTSRRVGGLPAGRTGSAWPRWATARVVAGDGQVFVLRRGAPPGDPGRHGDRRRGLAGRSAACGCWSTDGGARCGRSAWRDGPAGRPGGCPAHRPARRHPARPARRDRTRPAGGDRGALLDPGTGSILARYPEVHGVAGDLVLGGDPERHAGPFTLTDQRTGARHPVARPTPHGQAGVGLASPDGRLLAVEFADLSWGRVKGQVSDIWLLDLRDPALAAAAGHAPDHRGQVHEHGLDRRRAAGAGGRLRAVRRGPRGVAPRPGPAGRQAAGPPRLRRLRTPSVAWPAAT